MNLFFRYSVLIFLGLSLSSCGRLGVALNHAIESEFGSTGQVVFIVLGALVFTGLLIRLYRDEFLMAIRRFLGNPTTSTTHSTGSGVQAAAKISKPSSTAASSAPPKVDSLARASGVSDEEELRQIEKEKPAVSNNLESSARPTDDVKPDPKPDHEMISEKPTTAPSTKVSKMAEQIDKDPLYQQAYAEIESGRKVVATWSRAFAEGKGQGEESRALYIQYRVESLKEQLVEKLERERAVKE